MSSDVKLLYVEDEPLLAQVVKESLESRGFNIHLITHGDEVIPCLNQNSFDLCILDVMLPGLDGFSLAELIRKKYPQLPIIFLTAKNSSADVITGFKAGGNDYLRKPFSVEELIVRIKNLLQLSQGQNLSTASGVEHHFGRFRFHPGRYELKLDDQSHQLSHREAQLLMLFMENQNQIVSRKDILMHIWGDDSFFNSRNLDVYIRKLRKYLEVDPSVRLLTLKGVGYRVVVE